MNNENTIALSFSLDNKEGNFRYPDEISSLVFGFVVNTYENGLEFDVEYIEQVDANELEIEVLIQKDKLFSMYSIIKNPLSVIVGTIDCEFKIEPSKIAIKKIIELNEFEFIEYCTETLLRI